MHYTYFRNSIIVLVIALLLAPMLVGAGRVDELEQQIDDKNKQIEKIQEDINKYTNELTGVQAEKKTLQNAVHELDVSRQKVSSQINLTQNEIDGALYNIEKLDLEIGDREQEISVNTEALKESMRRIHEYESQTFVETLLEYDNLSDFWDELDTLEQFQGVVQQDLHELVALKQQLETDQKELQTKQHELSQLKTQLFGQREVIDQNKSQKDTLLEETASEEAKYQSLLAEKIRQREIFLQELSQIEEQLRIAVDPNSIPSTRSGVLAWPLDKVLITQYFGNTPFASANPQVYNGRGHNGVDLAASIGTPVKAALSGTVTATGNTDLQAGCYSYGKWVLLKHTNGLSTLYAHLSVISVGPGQTLHTGDIIGLSGSTGYTTGPHLHFTVFATEGVRVVRLGDVKAVTNCGNMEIPVAPQEAYLNPLSYL